MSVNRSDLEDLHRLLVASLRAKLEDGTATAAEMNVVRQLLQASGIDFIEKNYDELQKLNVPFPSADELEKAQYGVG